MEREEVLARLEAAYFSEERHEKALLDHLGELLGGVELFVDVGASLGQYTYFANRLLRGARLVAIEADPLRFAELERHCRDWQQEGGNRITALHAAVSDEDGSTPFQVTGSDVSGGLFRHPTGREDVAWEEVRVPAISLDETFRDRLPDLVKVDVEGAEWRVLRGARRLLEAGRTRWLIELHGWGDPEGRGRAEDVYRLMESFGYHARPFYGSDLFTRERPPFAARLHARARRLARLWAARLRA